MKRFFATVLALCMVCGVALATDAVSPHQITEAGKTADTTVKYEITENRTFTVTIPASVDIDPATNRGTMNFEINAPRFNAPNLGIIVHLTGAANEWMVNPYGGIFHLISGDDTIPYKLVPEGNGAGNPYSLNMGETIMSWRYGQEAGPTKATTVTAIAEPGDGIIAAGTYKDWLTFTVSLFDHVTDSPVPMS